MAIEVTVVYSPAARESIEVVLQLDAGATVAQALRASGLLAQFTELTAATPPVGVWGKRVSYRQPLRDQDRLEVYRALTVDPKVARRSRFAKQGVGAAGLFAHKRAGAKAGY